MFGKPSLMTRIAIGKAIGFAVGLIGLIFMPLFYPDADWWARIGILLWYTTVGAFVSVFGVLDWHPVLKLPMPWWFRSSLIGSWMNFVLVFFAHDLMTDFLTAMFGPDGFLQSPFWFVLEGTAVGLLIGYVATKVGGEGAETAGR